MDDIGTVKVVYRTEQVIDYYLCMLLIERNSFVIIEDLGQVLVHVVHYQENSARLFPTIFLLWDNHIN